MFVPFQVETLSHKNGILDVTAELIFFFRAQIHQKFRKFTIKKIDQFVVQRCLHLFKVRILHLLKISVINIII